MNFIVVGGGCFGSFYIRQLLRGVDRIGFKKVLIVDHDSQCQAAREFGSLQDARIEFHVEDWKNFLLSYFFQTLESYRKGGEVEDQYVPPTFAPHILMEIFLELAQRANPALRFNKVPVDETIGTPVDMALPAGTRALSFATWRCPASCIEPPTCPHTRGPKAWDMKEFLSQKVAGAYIFQCRHYAMGVGTISVRAILDEYERFEKVALSPGEHQMAMATVSSCHGLIGCVEVSHG